MTVSPVPEGFHTITPFLLIEKLPQFLDFLAEAFDSEEVERATLPDGTVMHAEVRIGDSRIMMGTARDEWPAMPAFLHLYLPDAEAAYRKAVAAGATSVQEPKDEFYGDRTCGVKDPFGNLWWFATRQEEVSPDELDRRMAAHAGEK